MSAELLRRTRRTSALAALFALGACSWFTDFKEQPKFDPWESPSDTIPMRGNPQNSVSVYGSAAPGFAVSRMPMPGTIDSMKGLANPVAADARSLDNGRKYYTINCAVCHGFEGNGDGAATKYGMPGIGIGKGSNAAGALTDGYIWGMMRNGRGLMPSYNRIEEMDRWDVVNYIRGLQGRYQVATGPVGFPGETGDKVPGFSQSGPTRPSPWFHRAGAQAGPAAAPHEAGVAPSESPASGATGTHAPSTTPDLGGSTDTLHRPAPRVTPVPTPNTTPKAGGER